MITTIPIVITAVDASRFPAIAIFQGVGMMLALGFVIWLLSTASRDEEAERVRRRLEREANRTAEMSQRLADGEIPPAWQRLLDADARARAREAAKKASGEVDGEK